ncbi:unnamed protein product [Rotaria sp. Silwood2]|nr:unnamed protein product [Rotaria sp. Silwood2]CAF4029902.1 unnamed protein product [Rotaria sp. Silwood2]
MKSTQNNDDNELNLETLLNLIKILDITYDDDCSQLSGWNLSDVDDIPISILNLTKEEQRSVTSLDREGTTFMWKTLLIDCLINMDYEDNDNRDDIVEILKKKHKDDPEEIRQIDDFHKNYKKTDAILWYKKESPIYRELNEALRRSCINILFAFRFFIRDLKDQLEEEHKNFLDTNGGNMIYLYRGQRMSKDEIDKLQKLNRDCLISVDGYFSTSRSTEIAAGFMTPKTEKDNKMPVRYDITCDLKLTTKPFADISSERFGDFSNEEEVLFMVGTIFQFKGMLYDKKSKFWRIKLKLIDEHQHRWFNLYNSIKEQMGEETNLLTLGGLLVTAGDHEHALRVYMCSFIDLIIVHDHLTDKGHQHLARSLMGIASVQGELGRYDESIQILNETIKYINNYINKVERNQYRAEAYYHQSLPLSEKGEYLDALKQCKHALEIFIKYHGHHHANVANVYEMIGNIHANFGRLAGTKHNFNDQHQYVQRAYAYHNRALEARKKIYKKTPDHPDISCSYINIGELLRDIGKPDEALKYTLKALKTFTKSFPKSHYWIGVTLDNIGEIYVQQRRFNEAKEKYDEAIDVYKKTLPSDHRFIGETLHNIGKLYCCTHVFDKSLDYFIQAKQIYDKKIPNNHYLAVELRKQINYVSSQLHGQIGR